MPEDQEVPINDPSLTEAPVHETNLVNAGVEETDRELTLSERIARDHPDWPPLKLKFYLSSHETALDMQGLQDELQDADIYLYEDVYGNTYTDFFQMVADITETNDPENLEHLINFAADRGLVVRGGFSEAQIRALYGSKVKVGHIDLRPGDPIYDQIPTTEKYEPGKQGFHEPTFEATLLKIKERAEIHAEFEDRREKIMVDRFEQELTGILTARPDLKDKPNLQIVATMGASHTTLYDKFMAEGIQTEHMSPEGHNFNDYWKQVNHTISSDVEPSRELLARVYLEDLMFNMIQGTLAEETVNTDMKYDYIVNCVSQFSAEEIETIHGLEQFSAEIFDAILQAKDLPQLPHSGEELKNIVDNQKAAQKTKPAEIKASSPHIRPTQRD